MNHILTGTPGSGKTTLLRALEMNSFPVVEEVATDVIEFEQANGNTEPWTKPEFIDQVTRLQIVRRKLSQNSNSAHCIFDRSPFCTVALTRYLNYPIPPVLNKELDFLLSARFYSSKVFFVENLGHIKNTDARKIQYEEALRFEQIHREVYTEFGFSMIVVPKAEISERVTLLTSLFDSNRLSEND